jgi:hypothetical protein
VGKRNAIQSGYVPCMQRVLLGPQNAYTDTLIETKPLQLRGNHDSAWKGINVNGNL